MTLSTTTAVLGLRTMPRGITMLTDTRMTALTEDLVLFDIGGVQLELDYSKFFYEASRLAGMAPSKFKDAYVNSDIETGTLTGTLSTGEYFRKLREIIGKYLSEEKLRELIGYSWKCQANEVLDVKDEVMNAGYLVANFSNISEIAHEIIGGRHRRIFESDVMSHPGIYSYEIGAIKSDRRMYEKAGGYNVTLIDDNEAYVRASIEKFGWNGILFTPYIDPAEAVRSAQSGVGVHSDDIVVSNSVEELVRALRRFEVNI